MLVYFWCDNCGTRMSADLSRYCCTTYLNKGGPASGCTYNSIKETVIDEYVNKWLDEVAYRTEMDRY